MKELIFKNKTLASITICIIVVLFIYLHTLNRPWIFYDERLIYNEDLIPIPHSLEEVFEIVKTFGIENNLTSSNYLYSSVVSIKRNSIFSTPFLLITGLFFGKSAFLYHLFNLILHMINTIFVFLILKSFTKDNLILIILTLLWSCHPVHAESILLSTNMSATLSYTAFFYLFYDFILNISNDLSLKRSISILTIFILFLMFNEHIIMLPLTVFAFSILNELKKSNLRDSLLQSIKKTSPYLVGFLLFVAYFTLSKYEFIKTGESSIKLIVERILWLSPQIIFHAIKLSFFPKALSLDQSSLVKLGESLFDTYSIFCILAITAWITVPCYLYLKNKSRFWLVTTSSLFIISILPFSQVLSQTYCLFAERYLYTPIFFLVFGYSIFSSTVKNKKVEKIALLILLICFSTRTMIRTLDWTNNYALITSSIKTSNNLLLKAFRYNDLAVNCSNSKEEYENYKNTAKTYVNKALSKLKDENNKPTPGIIYSYGLDKDSFISKGIYYLSLIDLESTDQNLLKSNLSNYESSIKHIKKLDPLALELYANLLIKNNKLNQARDIFHKMYDDYPKLPITILSLIRLERDIEKDLPTSKKYLLEGLKLFPYSKEILFEALKTSQTEGNFSEYAKYSYLNGLRTHNSLFYREALVAFLTINDLKSAELVVKKITGTDSENPLSLYLVSSFFIRNNDFDNAIKYLTLAKDKANGSNANENLKLKIDSALEKLLTIKKN